MRVRTICSDDTVALIEFSKAVYPQRRDIEERFKLLSSSPWSGQNSSCSGLIGINDCNKIIGQILFIPGNVWYRGSLRRMYWSCDLVVLKKYRMSMLGGLLTVRGLRTFSPFFGAGFSDKGMMITRAAKSTVIGALTSYVRPSRSTLFSAFQIIGRRARVIRFTPTPIPDEISTGCMVFRLIQAPEGLNNWSFRAFDENILEFDRTREFLAWRFFSSESRYLFYRAMTGDSNLYFVGRVIKIKRGPVELYGLAIVDYRITTDLQLFNLIAAAQTLAKRLQTDFIWTASSNVYSDRVLRKAGFYRVGRPGLILTNMEVGKLTSQIIERRSIIATPADGDVDLNR